MLVIEAYLHLKQNLDACLQQLRTKTLPLELHNEALYLQGAILYTQQNFHQAISHFSQIDRESLPFTKACHLYAYCLYKLQERGWEKQIVSLLQNPRYLEPHHKAQTDFYLAHAYVQLQQWELASQIIEQSDNTSSQMLFFHGLVYDGQQQYQKAVEKYTACLNINIEHKDALVKLMYANIKAPSIREPFFLLLSQYFFHIVASAKNEINPLIYFYNNFANHHKLRYNISDVESWALLQSQLQQKSEEEQLKETTNLLTSFIKLFTNPSATLDNKKYIVIKTGLLTTRYFKNIERDIQKFCTQNAPQIKNENLRSDFKYEIQQLLKNIENLQQREKKARLYYYLIQSQFHKTFPYKKLLWNSLTHGELEQCLLDTKAPQIIRYLAIKSIAIDHLDYEYVQQKVLANDEILSILSSVALKELGISRIKTINTFLKLYDRDKSQTQKHMSEFLICAAVCQLTGEQIFRFLDHEKDAVRICAAIQCIQNENYPFYDDFIVDKIDKIVTQAMTHPHTIFRMYAHNFFWGSKFVPATKKIEKQHLLYQALCDEDILVRIFAMKSIHVLRTSRVFLDRLPANIIEQLQKISQNSPSLPAKFLAITWLYAHNSQNKTLQKLCDNGSFFIRFFIEIFLKLFQNKDMISNVMDIMATLKKLEKDPSERLRAVVYYCERRIMGTDLRYRIQGETPNLQALLLRLHRVKPYTVTNKKHIQVAKSYLNTDDNSLKDSATEAAIIHYFNANAHHKFQHRIANLEKFVAQNADFSDKGIAMAYYYLSNQYSYRDIPLRKFANDFRKIFNASPYERHINQFQKNVHDDEKRKQHLYFLSKAIQYYPMEDTFWYERSLLYSKHNKNVAIKDINKAIAILPRTEYFLHKMKLANMELPKFITQSHDPKVLQKAIATCFVMQQPQKAWPVLRQLSHTAGSTTQLHVLLSKYYLQLSVKSTQQNNNKITRLYVHKASQHMWFFNTFAKFYPLSPTMQQFRNSSLSQMHLFDKDRYNREIQILPNARTHLMRAKTYAFVNDFTKAKRDFNHAVQLAKNKDRYYIARANFLLQYELYHEALRDYQSVNPNGKYADVAKSHIQDIQKTLQKH